MKSLTATILLVSLLEITQAQELPCKSYFSQKEGEGRCRERYREDSNGEKHGMYISYFADGTIESRGNYQHGLMQGNWLNHGFKNGNIFSTMIQYYSWYEKGVEIAQSNEKPINSYTEARALASIADIEAKKENDAKADAEERAAQERKINQEFSLLNEKYEFGWNDDIDKVKNLAARYCSLAEKYPNDSRAGLAKAKCEETINHLQDLQKQKPNNDAYINAVNKGTYEGYIDYLKKYPNGFHSETLKQAIKYGRAKFLFNTSGYNAKVLFESYLNGQKHENNYVQIDGDNFKIDLTTPQSVWVRDTVFFELFKRASEEGKYFDLLKYYDQAVKDGCDNQITGKIKWVKDFANAMIETTNGKSEKSISILINCGERNYLVDFLIGSNYLILSDKTKAKEFLSSFYNRSLVSGTNQYKLEYYNQVNDMLEAMISNGLSRDIFKKITSKDNADDMNVNINSLSKFLK